MGLILLVTGLRLPGIVYSAVSSVAGTIAPVSMIMIGMLLSRVNFREVFQNKKIYLVALLRMIVTPAIVLLFLKVSHLSALAPDGFMILYVTFMACITPAATTVTQLAQLYRLRPEYASAINVFTTLLCIATMPLMTWIYTCIM